MLRRLRVLLPCLLLLAAPAAKAHPGYFETALHAHDVERAKPLARREHKQIFVAVTSEARDGWPVLRWPDPTSQALVDLLVRESVLVELTSGSGLAGVRGRPGAGEGLLLLDARGRWLREFPIDTPPAVLERELRRHFASPATLARIQRAVADLGPDHFVSRERLARALQEAGRPDEARLHYAWCIDAALESRSRAAEARRPHVLAGLAALARRDEDARALLESTRRRAAARVRADPEARRLARDLAQLNAALGRRSENARLFDALPRKARARHALVDPLLHDLVAQGRGDEVLLLVDPLEGFRGEVELYRRNRILRPASAERGRGRGSRSFVLERGIALLRALEAQGDARSEALRRAILEFDDSAEVRERVQRPGVAER